MLGRLDGGGGFEEEAGVGGAAIMGRVGLFVCRGWAWGVVGRGDGSVGV